MSQLSKTLRERRKKAAEDANALLRKAVVTKEDHIKIDAFLDEADKLGAQIDAEEREEALIANSREVTEGKFRALETSHDKEHRMAFDKYLRHGLEAMKPEERTRLFERRDTVNGQQAGTQSISYTAGAAGGFLVPAGFVYEVEQRRKYFARLMDGDVCDVINTETGAVLPFPVGDDTSNVATVIGENTQVSEEDVTLQQVTLGAFKYTTGVIRVSMELLQDSAINLDTYLAARFGERFGRGMEHDLTRGTGSTVPTGILTAVTASGVTPVYASGTSANDGSGSTTGIGTNDLIALEHSVDPAYRMGGKFMFHDSTLKQIKQLLDRYGRPIWLPGIAVNAPDSILGYPYCINQSMPVEAADANIALFGDLKAFKIRNVRQLSILRLNERYADYGQVGFVAFARVDSNLVAATGANCINYLQQHS